MHLPASVIASGASIGSLWIIHNVVPNWTADVLESIVKKLFIHNRHGYAMYTHAKRHQLPTNDHVGKVQHCDDSPCDLLRKPTDDLGLR